MGNVIHRGKGSFTHVENTVFFDHDLSLKAKGIYCQIRSLENNPDWVFTVRGFSKLVKDGVDSVTAGIKELESAGYIIRARKRSENGRFLKAEEATWITLDDPKMHAEITRELKEEGFAILSEFAHDPANGVEVELDMSLAAENRNNPEFAQHETRTGKSVSGKSISGESLPINYSSDKPNDVDKTPLSSLPEKTYEQKTQEKGHFIAYRKGEFPEAFEKLCQMSIKPVSSLRFKRDCLAAWERQLENGYEPGQIIEAYEAYARSYWIRNADDATLAKNLIRWLEGEGGLIAFAEEPIPPSILGRNGDPLSMEELAEADPDFAPLWRKLESARAVVRSIMFMDGHRYPEEEVLEACKEDAQYQRCLARCKERYERYLKIFELFHQSDGKDKPQ